MLTAAWSLYLEPYYQFERWTVLVGVPQSVALASINAFGRIFASVAVIALLVAFLLGRRLIHRNLEPLLTLGHATEQLAAGRFAHRIGLQSGDEFQQLSDAFDNMAAQIGDKIDELEALARMDRALQDAQSIDAVLGAAAGALAELNVGEGNALLCHEHWTTPGTLWRCASGIEGVTTVDVGNARHALDDRGGEAVLQVADECGLRDFLGASAEPPFSVYPVLRSAAASADIAIQGLNPGGEAIVQRVADVLAIALDNVIKERRLSYQANHDWLTGLPNRLQLKDLFDAWTADTARSERVVGMLLLGLDRFKQINESMGHFMGDRLLTDVGERLRAALPERDVVGRVAGDQFVVMLAETDLQRLLLRLSEVAASLARELDRPFRLGARDLRLAATMGAAAYPRDGDGFEAMLQSIDAASFAAKSSRRGGLLIFSDEMRAALAGRLEVEQGLKEAIVNNELVMHYQPVVDARTHRIRSAEALMRWQRPGVGLLLPGSFIDVAEQSGLIGEMGAWAIGEVCRQIGVWRENGLEVETININVSSVQLASDGLDEQVEQALRAANLPAGTITLEVTESALIADLGGAVERLMRLRQLGVRIMVDDFGTGYASFKYLKLLPIDGLKIDRLFVKDLPHSRQDAAIVAAIVSLARASEFKVVAEGVETGEQADFLCASGVAYLQGFLFGKGLTAVEMQASLYEERAAPVLGALGR
jgi:diguanylate cyclase (GGDEF)-like protein